MFKSFQIIGYSVNKRGLTVGFNLRVKAMNAKQAQDDLLRQYNEMGCDHTRITRLIEVGHDE